MKEAHPQSEQRSQARQAVDAQVFLTVRGRGCTALPGRMFELSVDGCRVLTEQELPFANPAPIEVRFKVNGIGFRLAGTMELVDASQTAEVRFSPMPPRRREALEGLLDELEAGEQARMVAEARARVAAESQASPATPDRQLQSAIPISAASPKSGEAHPGILPSGHPGQERRGETRHAVDTGATIYFIDVRAKMTGRIVDVSLSGCRIRTFEPFRVGIYRRVETEFNVDGLPFRLAGVVQALHDNFSVGIRFLDVSPRKRDQLALLIEDIRRWNAGISLVG